jgi:hypothetical protein
MSADDGEERRAQRQRKRQQIQREFGEMLRDSATESAMEIFRLFAWILFFILLLTVMTPNQ